MLDVCSLVVGTVLGYTCYATPTCPDGTIITTAVNDIFPVGDELGKIGGLIAHCNDGLLCCSSN